MRRTSNISSLKKIDIPLPEGRVIYETHSRTDILVYLMLFFDDFIAT